MPDIAFDTTAPFPADLPEPGLAEKADSLADRLAAEMRGRWQAGERPLSETFLTQHPELRDQPAAAIDLIYEEICLRQDAGEEVDEAEILGRFPQWRSQLAMLLNCDRVLSAAPPEPRFPEAGERLGDFLLLVELGRGLQGRVFLARQASLSDRPMVLKLIPQESREHLSLSRLQHSHIVPLYAVQDDPVRHLRLLCMPYFGGITLARLLQLVRDRSAQPGTARVVVRALSQETTVQSNWPILNPAKAFLEQLSFVQAICWMGACLADALAYAHVRGIVHLDLKPSNVLWAGDGQPMLLDFHLAREPLAVNHQGLEGLGGSRPYMSPEHEMAFAAAKEGRPIPAAVDERSDVYSLGMVLYEALGGALTHAPASGLDAGKCEPLRPLHDGNPHVSIGLSDIIHRCLAFDPNERYSSATAVADDLRRHLNDLPLRGVRNRSLRERWRKLRRRRPHAVALAAMLAIVLTATAAAGIGAWNHVAQKADEVRAALREGEQLIGQGRHADAADAFQRGMRLVDGVPWTAELKQKLANGSQSAKLAQAAADHGRLVQELHRQADQIRFQYSAESLPPSQLRAIAEACQRWWNKRLDLWTRLGPETAAALRQQVQSDLLDLAIFRAELAVHLAPADARDDARQNALRVLTDASALFGTNAVLDREQKRLSAGGVAVKDARIAEPETPWEMYALGRSLYRSGDLEGAGRQFEKAVERRPQDLWANYYWGLCAYRLGRWEDAVTAFTACSALAPSSAACVYNRALAYSALGQRKRARADYGRALEVEPSLAAAALNRGILHFQAQRYDAAIADFQRALGNGADPASVHYNLALVYRDQGELSDAQRCLERALEHAPEHKEARALMEELRGRH
jgi:serine/threonine protein kinase/tetratricopeptide (TPR) repeat protein